MAAKCPFESNGEVKEPLDSENNWDKVIPIPPHLKKTTYGDNNYLFQLSYVKPYHLIGVGLLASLFLPTIIIIILSLIFFIYPFIKQILRYYNYLPVPYSDHVIRTMYSARCDGDFVVFLIGIRPNGANPFNGKFSGVATAFRNMVKELEAEPTLGYMGGDFYIGVNDRKSKLLHVQYWRNYESLQKWTHTRMGIHVKAVTDYLKSDRADGENGIWHETYKVRDGEYEAIYGNMPPIGLALATEAVLETKINNGPKRMERRKKEKEAQTAMTN